MKNIDRFQNTRAALSAWRRASASEPHLRFEEWLMSDADPRAALFGTAHELVDIILCEGEIGTDAYHAAERLAVALRYYKEKEKECGATLPTSSCRGDVP